MRTLNTYEIRTVTGGVVSLQRTNSYLDIKMDSVYEYLQLKQYSFGDKFPYISLNVKPWGEGIYVYYEDGFAKEKFPATILSNTENNYHVRIQLA